MTQQKLITTYGNPLSSPAAQAEFEKKHMMIYRYPADIVAAIPCLGSSVYCNKDFQKPYEIALRKLIALGLHKEIKENDQCFLPRYQRGSTTIISIHSWAMAIDLNPDQNPIYSTREQCKAKGLVPFTPQFVQVWRDCGFNVGEDFPGRPDLMHYEWTKQL